MDRWTCIGTGTTTERTTFCAEWWMNVTRQPIPECNAARTVLCCCHWRCLTPPSSSESLVQSPFFGHQPCPCVCARSIETHISIVKLGCHEEAHEDTADIHEWVGWTGFANSYRVQYNNNTKLDVSLRQQQQRHDPRPCRSHGNMIISIRVDGWHGCVGGQPRRHFLRAVGAAAQSFGF